MFKWSYEYTFEVNLPKNKVWDFYSNPSNWPKLMDKVDSCHVDGEIQKGSIVMAKIKNRKYQMPLLVKEFKPYSEFTVGIKTFLIDQDSSLIVEPLSSEKSKITMKIAMKSILTPFLRSYFYKHVEREVFQRVKTLQELVN